MQPFRRLKFIGRIFLFLIGMVVATLGWCMWDEFLAILPAGSNE